MRAQSRVRAASLLSVALAATTLSGAPALASSESAKVGAASLPSATDAKSKANCPQLKLADHWYGNNAKLIQRAIDKAGRCSWPGGQMPQVRPYAVFDWDNTVIKNDISDQTIFWMLSHDKILQPPGKNWRNTSRFMTDAGAKALREACGNLAEAGKPLPTSTNVTCADEILSVRKTQKTTNGEAVFAGANERYMEASYAWVGQIMQGYTPAQVRKIAAQARDAALNAPIGATQKVGSSTETAWIRYYPEMRDLITTLKKAGIEPWIVSASPKEFADVWGPGVGVDSGHTIGIEQLLHKGKLTGHLKGCGGLADGSDAIMTYIDGKRCFINKIILGINGPRALTPMPSRLRPTIAGGDATTDVSMLRDATGAHVVLNRNKDELMCHAYDNADKRWAINPMFIQPLPQKQGLYPCSTTAYVDANGKHGPVRRTDGSIIPDQKDTIFG
ncbi:MAG: haloacid dehalogenase-like hydrolase [Micropruina sp.]|uniref:haloacid dehalogenase-like hydrolase n=1 Tax=Micropruina sp. TaxID=2737536 RepID=UPI0039E3BB46